MDCAVGAPAEKYNQVQYSHQADSGVDLINKLSLKRGSVAEKDKPQTQPRGQGCTGTRATQETEHCDLCV